MIFDNLKHDLKYAIRGLRTKPAFAIAVIATLGLGIGANAAMFGIVDRLLFRPPAYLIAPERSNRIYLTYTLDGNEGIRANTSYQRYLDLARASRTLDAVAAVSMRKEAIG